MAEQLAAKPPTTFTCVECGLSSDRPSGSGSMRVTCEKLIPGPPEAPEKTRVCGKKNALQPLAPPAPQLLKTA
jgi:hypothetical protein